MTDAVDRLLEHAEREATAIGLAIERACEKALQDGQHGVLVVTRLGSPIEVGPHPSVPYGEIHYREEWRP